MSWDTVTPILDPFFMDGYTWVVLGPIVKDGTNMDYIFALINASTGALTKLSAPLPDTNNYNANKAGFAVVSFVDTSTR